MHTSSKKARTHPKMQLTCYYCSKCCMDNADHSYKQCPTWKFCGFCDKVRHWGFHCSTLHVKCTRLRCGVYIGHRHIGKMCPWSRETKVDNFHYSCDGQVADLPHAMMIYEEGLDLLQLFPFLAISPPYSRPTRAPTPFPFRFTFPLVPRIVRHITFPYTSVLLHLHLLTWLPSLSSRTLDSSMLAPLSPTTHTILRLMPVMAGPSQASLVFNLS